MIKRGGFFACALVLLLASVFLLYHLGNEPLQDYDEATYAQVVHEALGSHHYFSMTLGGENYFKKPPLTFWAMMLSETALGENTFAMRLPFVLFGIAALAALMLLIYEVAESWWIATLGGAVLATTAPFMETARQVRLDIPVIFFIILATYCFMRGLKNPKWLLAFGAAVGLGLMTKSVIAGFAVVAAVFVIVLYRRFDLFKNKYAYGGVAVAFLVAAPWHLWEWAHFGGAFWKQYVGVEVLSRAEMNLFWTVTLTNADYIHYLEWFTEPWLWVFFVALAAAALGYKRLPQDNRRFITVCAGTIAIMIAVFFIAKTKAPTYLLPIYPFAATVIALAAALAPAPTDSRRRAILSATCALLAVLIVSGAQSTYYNAYHHNPYYSVEITMAIDERAIAQPLASVPKSTPVYVYDDENLGSISYYSQHLYLLALGTTTVPAAGSYVIVDTDGVQIFSKNFIDLQTQTVYSGSQVSLLKIQ